MERLTSRQTKEQVDALMQDPRSLYGGAIMNRRGRSKGTDVPYSEIIAKRLLHVHQFPELLRQLPKVPHGQLFRPEDHDGTTLDPTILGMEQEDRVAVALYNHKTLGSLGKVLDYLVPVTYDGKTIGTIDIVTFDASTSTLNLIGYAFHEQRRDTLLRCVLEIATLVNSVDEFRFARMYEEKLLDDQGVPVRPLDVKVVPVVLLLEGSYQDRSIPLLKRMVHVADLIQELGVRMFVIGIELQLRDKPRFNRKSAIHPYRPVLHYVPVLRERMLPTA